MAQVAYCDGEILVAVGQATPFQCYATAGTSGTWIFKETTLSDDELLNQALSKRLLSREDFTVLSAGILAILIVAMGLRLVLKTLNIGEKTNEKN